MCRHPALLVLSCLACILSWTAHLEAGEKKRSVADLIADLKKGEKEQLQALSDLEALGPKAAEATPALIDLLSNKTEIVRLQSAIALGKIGKEAVTPLIKSAGASDADVRFYSIWALAFIGPQAKSATPVMVKALSDKSADIRRKAAYALGRIDPEPDAVVPGLVGLLGDDIEDVRQAAASALPKLGKAAVPALIDALKSTKTTLRNQAARILGETGAAAADAIPKLKAMLLDEEKGSADAAADALAGIGPAALKTLVAAAQEDSLAIRGLALRSLQKIGAPAVPFVVDLLGAKHDDVRRQSATMLGQMQVNDKSVVIALGFALKDKDFQVRRNALASLRGMGTGAKLAEQYVSGALTDIDPNIRREAFETLRGLGVDPKPGLKKALASSDPNIRINTACLMTALNWEVELAEPVLLEGLKHKDVALKMQAATALAQRGLRADEVLPIFLEGLENDLASVRRQAAEAIVPYGSKAKKAGPALIRALEDADDSVSAQALQTLRHVGEDPKVLFPAMIKVLRRKEEKLHAAAAQVIFQVGPDAIGEISKLLKDEKAPGVRLACLQTLAMVGPPAKEAVPQLIEALGDTSARARMTAARALGNIGPAAKAALDALGKAEKDDDNNVKAIAKAAVAQINADGKEKMFEVHGVVTPGDPFDRVRTSHYHVVHTYRMKEGQTYTIDLVSSWDNFLRLENAKGEQLAQDDDGGGFPNARITFRAPADGWYRIIVTTYGGGAHGPYRLTVR